MVEDVTASEVPFTDREIILRVMKFHDAELGERLKALVVLGPFDKSAGVRDIQILEVVANLPISGVVPSPLPAPASTRGLQIYRMRQEEFENPSAVVDTEIQRRTNSWIFPAFSYKMWIVLERPHGYVFDVLTPIDRDLFQRLGNVSFSELLGVHQ